MNEGSARGRRGVFRKPNPHCLGPQQCNAKGTSMNRLPYLNVGCGNKFHEAWVNVDMLANGPHIIPCNLLKGIPFPNDHFEVVYHSEVLEHFPKEKAPAFLRECYRVLKPGGIMRMCVPDLENIVTEYLAHLNALAKNPSNKETQANYDWILLELFDQTVRDYPGGEMAEFLRQPDLVNEKYIIQRIGHVGRSLRNSALAGGQGRQKNARAEGLLRRARYLGLKQATMKVLGRITKMWSSRACRIGRFRLGGEIHFWMYDRYSLERLLRQMGFESVQRKTPLDSDIPGWGQYELDVKNGEVFHPTSLFMEARKPL
jgi:predicted SAM-dependent methyltransferase